MPSHGNCCAAMIKLGHPSPQQKKEQHLAIHWSVNRNNSSKSCLNDSFASLSHKGNNKQLHLSKKSRSLIKGNFCSPKSIIDSDSKSESDGDSGFVDSFDYKSEVKCNK